MPDRTEPRDAQHVREPHPDDILKVALKRYANGKVFVSAATSRRFGSEVTRALEQTAEIRVVFDRQAFAARLEAAGLGEADIRLALDSLKYVDEAYLADRWPS